MVKVKELFTSIQGEGPYVGYKQLFIRLCGCNLKCEYCDTEFDSLNSQEYSLEELLEIIDKNLDCHSVSLTGGEPLLHSKFIQEFATKCRLPVYLETNGVLYKNLEEIIEYVDYISADIKLPSCTGLKPYFEEHDKFFKIASEKNLFAKVVFNSRITEEEIRNVCALCKKYDIELVLQPMMVGKTPGVSSEFMAEILNKCLRLYSRSRLIPQVHKFIDVI